MLCLLFCFGGGGFIGRCSIPEKSQHNGKQYRHVDRASGLASHRSRFQVTIPLVRNLSGEERMASVAASICPVCLRTHCLNEQTPVFCPPLSLVAPAPRKAIKSPLQKPWEGVVRSCFKRPLRGRGHRSNWQSIAEDRKTPLIVPPREVLPLKAPDKVHSLIFPFYTLFFIPVYSGWDAAQGEESRVGFQWTVRRISRKIWKICSQKWRNKQARAKRNYCE